MTPSRRSEPDPLGPLHAFVDRLADRWCRLDRGWQAVLLGLGIVAVQLLVQVV